LGFNYFEEGLCIILDGGSADDQFAVFLLVGDESMRIGCVGQVIDFELYFFHELLGEETIP
jgi:hypothetical protein